MIKHVLLAVIMACSTTAHAQVSIWGPSSPTTNKPTEAAPAPVSPYVHSSPQATPKPAPVFPQVAPAPAPAPTPAPQVAPAPEPQKPKWSLQDVPNDPAPMVYPGLKAAPGPGEAPPVVMDKADTLKAIKDPEMRKELEKYSQGDKLVFPQNPPEMNENTAKILPSPQVPMPENDTEVPELFDECPTNDCSEEI